MRENPALADPASPAWAGLEDELNQPGADPAFDHLPRPYHVNIGTVAAGDWPPSVPALARFMGAFFAAGAVEGGVRR